MNGYQIVLIDGYDRPKTKCHGTAKKCHETGTHFSTINSCYVDTNNVYRISRMNGYRIVCIDGTIDQKLNAMGQQRIAAARELIF